MPLPPLSEASAASTPRPFGQRPNPKRRAPRFVQQRDAPHGADEDADTFTAQTQTRPTSRLRVAPRPSRFARRAKERIDVPPHLRSQFAGSATLDVEVEEADDGSVDVVDCEFIASRKDLQRWRLSLTDFHALITGGTEAIEAFREGQRQKEAAAAALQEEDIGVEAALLADEEALRKSTSLPHKKHHAPKVHDHEATWRAVLAWPGRTLKRLWHWLVRRIG